MYLYFDELGVLKEIVDGEHFRQGSNNANEIYMYFEGDRVLSSLTLTIKVNDENEEPITRILDVESDYEEEEIPFTTKELNYFKYYTTYKFYKYALTNEDLAYDGVLKITPRAYFEGGNEAYGLVVVNVEESVVVENPTITRAEYEDLLQQIANQNASIISINNLLSNGKVRLYQHIIPCVVGGRFQTNIILTNASSTPYVDVNAILNDYEGVVGVIGYCFEDTDVASGWQNEIYQAKEIRIDNINDTPTLRVQVVKLTFSNNQFTSTYTYEPISYIYSTITRPIEMQISI